MIPRVETLGDGRNFATIRETAQALGCCSRTIERAIYRGEIKAVRVGRAVRVVVPALDAWLRGQLEAPAKPWKREKRKGTSNGTI
ncbi:MAG: hypothetical protein FD180_1816 [Planctomycetota bacterium]|nr:MAG: hypothetical protein FD180_1816 [Planctomycetota bacterium]